MNKASKATTPKAGRVNTQSAFIKTSISLPKDVAAFADDKAARIGKRDGEPANFSKYVRDLIKADKQAEGVAK